MILDSETKAFMDVATILNPLQPDMVTAWIRGRIEFIEAGLAKCPLWFTRQLRLFDPDLRMRWDFYKSHWVIERLSHLDNLFHAVGIWDGDPGPLVLQKLREGDLWKTTPSEQIKKVHDEAERQQKANDHDVNEQLGTVLDKMTSRQVREFVEASEAMEHGEEIIPMGDDARFMQRLHDKNLELQAKGLEIPDNSDRAINPGMKPGRRRQRRDN